MRLDRFKREGAALGAGLALLLAPGCVSLLPEQEPSTIYRLGASVPDRSAGEQAAGEVILIERPAAPRALAGNRIATERGDGQIAYIAGANWISPTPDLVQELVLDTFDSHLADYTAARPVDGVAARYTLRLELRHFEAAYDEGNNRAPLARVSMRARLVDDETHQLLGVTTVTGEARASANRQGAIVQAFSEASREAARELADWSRSTLER